MPCMTKPPLPSPTGGSSRRNGKSAGKRACRLYRNGYNCRVKRIVFLGDSLEVLRSFPDSARRAAGFQLDRVQRGLPPDDFKPLGAVGRGVHEIRIRDRSGAYRVVYIATLAAAVYVLHAFQKKTQRAPKADLELARRRLALLRR
jgi:phage-related protein